MKKLILAVCAVALATVVHAATVDWTLTGTATEENYTVMVFASAIENHYDTYAELAAGALSTQQIAGYTSRGKTTYRTDAKVSSESADLASKLYVVLVSDSSAKEYMYAEIDITGKTYNPAAQETSPGLVSLASSQITSAGTIGEAVPEPTSGLLLLLGMAGLALRRKQK